MEMAQEPCLMCPWRGERGGESGENGKWGGVEERVKMLSIKTPLN